MKAFIDTSSLLKLYHKESDSDMIIKVLSGNINDIYLSELTILEIRSAIWKKVRTGELDIHIASKIILCFQKDYNKFQWIKLEKSIIKTASDLLMKYGNKGLRTLDSLQLASALVMKDEDCIFITSDNLLKSLFKQEHLNTF
ncbi:MAG: type II toxin-antitoxin system VapC family toxin [Candidatus Eremiobacterota bacterium]